MSLASMLKSMFSKPYTSVRPKQADDMVSSGAVLVDVRETHEWQAGHAPKARHIPLSQLGTRMRELPGGRPVVTVCRSGNRSAHAARMLAENGHEVANVSGGMRAWAAAGLPVIAKGGRAGAIR